MHWPVNCLWKAVREIWSERVEVTWKDGIEKLFSPSVWQYSYSSVHWMAEFVAKDSKGCLRKGEERRGKERRGEERRRDDRRGEDLVAALNPVSTLHFWLLDNDNWYSIKEPEQLTCGCCPEAPVSLPSVWRPQRERRLSGSTRGRRAGGVWKLKTFTRHSSLMSGRETALYQRVSQCDSIPSVSPVVMMAFRWTAGSPVSLDSMTARCGLQSPSFSFPQHWAQRHNIKTVIGSQGT